MPDPRPIPVADHCTRYTGYDVRCLDPARTYVLASDYDALLSVARLNAADRERVSADNARLRALIEGALDGLSGLAGAWPELAEAVGWKRGDS